MEALHYDERYTLEDYRRWEGDWELIEGRPYAMAPAPTKTHQRISLKIAMELYKQIQDICQRCEVLQDIDYIISDDTVVRPDVVVECDSFSEEVTKAPEIIFEIISPSTARRDETAKFELYRREGVTYYALVYPTFSTMKLYRLDDAGNYRKVGDFKEERVEFSLKRCEISFDVSSIWTK